MEIDPKDRERRGTRKSSFVLPALLLLLVACETKPPARSAAAGDEQATASSEQDGERALAPRPIVMPPDFAEPADPGSRDVGASSTPPGPPAPPRPPVTALSPQGDSTNASSPPVTYVPPPPAGNTAAVQPEPGGEPVAAPPEVEPQLRNHRAFTEHLILQARALAMQGMHGTVAVDLYIDERGRVQNTRVHQSSGHEQFDRLVMQLLHDDAEFSPAMNRGQTVATWFTQAVTFEPYRGP